MSKLGEALRQKYKTPQAAMLALGIDPCCLEKDGIVVGDSALTPPVNEDAELIDNYWDAAFT